MSYFYYEVRNEDCKRGKFPKFYIANVFEKKDGLEEDSIVDTFIVPIKDKKLYATYEHTADMLAYNLVVKLNSQKKGA